MPFELEATVSKDYIDLGTLLQVEGVQKVSPVIRLDAVLSVEEYKLHCQIKAVYSSFLNCVLTEGTMFPDNSNMPFLVLNQAAVKAFTVDKYSTMTVSANMEILLKENDAERKSVVCGIFDDGSETPAAYMSYDTAVREFPQSGTTVLLLFLGDKGDCDKVVKSIRRLGLNASFDENESLRWELMEQKAWLFLLAGIGFIACAAILIRKNRSLELIMRQGEIFSLLSAGLVEKETAAIYPLRLALAEMSCDVIASIVADITGSLSLFAVGVCNVIGLIYFILMVL